MDIRRLHSGRTTNWQMGFCTYIETVDFGVELVDVKVVATVIYCWTFWIWIFVVWNSSATNGKVSRSIVIDKNRRVKAPV